MSASSGSAARRIPTGDAAFTTQGACASASAAVGTPPRSDLLGERLGALDPSGRGAAETVTPARRSWCYDRTSGAPPMTTRSISRSRQRPRRPRRVGGADGSAEPASRFRAQLSSSAPRSAVSRRACRAPDPTTRTHPDELARCRGFEKSEKGRSLACLNLAGQGVWENECEHSRDSIPPDETYSFLDDLVAAHARRDGLSGDTRTRWTTRHRHPRSDELHESRGDHPAVTRATSMGDVAQAVKDIQRDLRATDLPRVDSANYNSKAQRIDWPPSGGGFLATSTARPTSKRSSSDGERGGCALRSSSTGRVS